MLLAELIDACRVHVGLSARGGGVGQRGCRPRGTVGALGSQGSIRAPVSKFASVWCISCVTVR